MHLSDRAGPDRDRLVPGEGGGFIDWDALAAALGRAGYHSPVMIEAATEHSEFREPEAFLKEACAAGRRIWRRLRGEESRL